MGIISLKYDVSFKYLMLNEKVRCHFISDVLGIPLEDYRKLKRCICISILDFNLDQRPKYHRVYRLRDQEGYEYSDLFEVHVIELKKPLLGTGAVDDWIRLMNAGTEEELDMIKTKNPGIVEAIGEVKRMSLRKELRALYEGHMKAVRDQRARDDYVRDQGMKEGRAEAVLELLKIRGEVSEELRCRILSVNDSAVLKELLICAAQAESVSEFEAKTNF